MKRVTVTIPDDLAKAVERFMRDQENPPALATVMQSALREYLAMKGHPQPGDPLRIMPAKRGSGLHDVSVDHDRYLTER